MENMNSPEDQMTDQELAIKANEEAMKEVETSRLECPFNPTLECERCRLYQTYPGGAGERECVFIVGSTR